VGWPTSRTCGSREWGWCSARSSSCSARQASSPGTRAGNTGACATSTVHQTRGSTRPDQGMFARVPRRACADAAAYARCRAQNVDVVWRSGTRTTSPPRDTRRLSGSCRAIGDAAPDRGSLCYDSLVDRLGGATMLGACGQGITRFGYARPTSTRPARGPGSTGFLEALPGRTGRHTGRSGRGRRSAVAVQGITGRRRPASMARIIITEFSVVHSGAEGNRTQSRRALGEAMIYLGAVVRGHLLPRSRPQARIRELTSAWTTTRPSPGCRYHGGSTAP
jgi:hypothetical protein